MRRRLDALTRVGRLQTLMHNVGRWRLHALERQQALLNEDLKATFEALESDRIAFGPQAKLVARHIRALNQGLDELVREEESARHNVLVQGTKAKLAESAIEAATMLDRRLNERKELVEIIERSLTRNASST